MECIIWESSNLIWCLSCSAFVRHGWIKFNVSDTQNFWRAKRVCYQFCSEIYSLQEQMSVTDFSRMARLGRFTADCLWLKTFPGREKWWGCIKSIGCYWQKVSFQLILKGFICALHFNYVQLVLFLPVVLGHSELW